LDLNRAVTDLERMLRRLISEDIELATALEPGLPPILADRTQIEQIVLNLAINARDAMPTGGTLTLGTASVEFSGETLPQGLQPGRYVLLSVSDSGTGMDEETKSRMFDPFFTTKPRGEGTGLGLATVYGIVRQSNGAVDVESEPGQGTTLRIYFPPADRPEGPEPLRQFLRERPRGTETVLLVEDEPAVRALARKALTGSGYRVLEAEDAAEALSVAHGQNGPIHLLLADVVMPHMNGRELAESLALFYPDAKVLFMSGHTEDAIIRHGVQTRGIPFLQKPFTPDTLARKVREVLDS
jgi:CheY-like chemotaxis protein